MILTFDHWRRHAKGESYNYWDVYAEQTWIVDYADDDHEGRRLRSRDLHGVGFFYFVSVERSDFGTPGHGFKQSPHGPSFINFAYYSGKLRLFQGVMGQK